VRKKYRGAPRTVANSGGGGLPRASRRRYTRATSDERGGVRGRPGRDCSAVVIPGGVWGAARGITGGVWGAARGIPGAANLHGNPPRTLGERVRMERHGPVRLGEDDVAAAADE